MTRRERRVPEKQRAEPNITIHYQTGQERTKPNITVQGSALLPRTKVVANIKKDSTR